MIKTRTWILLFAACAVALGLLSWFLFRRTQETAVVQVIQDGEVLMEVDLNYFLVLN